MPVHNYGEDQFPDKGRFSLNKNFILPQNALRRDCYGKFIN